MSGLVADATTEELAFAIAACASDLFATTTTTNVYPGSGKVQVTFGAGALVHAERMAMLLDEFEQRAARAEGGAL